MIDALVAWGSDDAIRAKVMEHVEAGADHVSLQVLTGEPSFPVEQWRRLAEILQLKG